MRASSGLLLVALGLLVLYLVLSDKYVCFVEFVDCMTGNTTNAGTVTTATRTTASTPTIQNSSSPDFFKLLKDAAGIGTTGPFSNIKP